MFKAVRPLFFALSPESAHGVAMAALRLGRPFLPLFAPWLRAKDAPVTVAGLRFPNRIGLAAGFDKAATAVDCWQHLGFGFAEIGTLTRHAQPGNERPRVWRYPAQQGLINRFGFNNPGADEAARRLQALKDAGRWPAHPIGINLGKSKVTPLEEAADDYLYSLAKLKAYADYIAVNVSSPNTPGLRSLQGVKPIKALIREVARARGKTPLFVKLAPDLSPKDLLASCDAILGAGADGLILTNTTLSREGLGAGPHPEGGLSGRPVQALSDQALARVAKHTRGRVPLMGVGGVFSAEDARRKLEFGATLVQVYTGFIYQGPGLAKEILKGLEKV